jgi:hypothetical protein
MDAELREAFDDVHAEVLALNGLIVGLAAAMQRRGFPAEVIEEAFELAEMTAIAAADSDKVAGLRGRGTKMLKVLDSLRKAMLD